MAHRRRRPTAADRERGRADLAMGMPDPAVSGPTEFLDSGGELLQWLVV